jgi:LmbE family N-acetylglucosaminyl deacetylase
MLPATLQRIMVVSPHCDDAVFGCGALLAAHPGSSVATLFAGSPERSQPLTDWDRAAGFRAGDDVMAARRDEDAQALALLHASPLWLPFHDSQYHQAVSSHDLSRALRDVLHVFRPHVLILPWGLFHSDHRLASDACLALRGLVAVHSWFFYEDALYRRIPGLLEERLALLRARGVRARRVTLSPDQGGARKREALRCYRSQLLALATPGRLGYEDALSAERYWLIES